MSLADASSIATICGVVLAAALLAYTAYQVGLSARVSRAQFWLELEKMFAQHDDVHFKLRPGGEWTRPNSGPDSPAGWAKVEDYMGLFEHCETMLRGKLIDAETFKSIFSYRINNILNNKRIVEAKLIENRDGWQLFIRLLGRLQIQIPGA